MELSIGNERSFDGASQRRKDSAGIYWHRGVEGIEGRRDEGASVADGNRRFDELSENRREARAADRPVPFTRPALPATVNRYRTMRFYSLVN